MKIEVTAEPLDVLRKRTSEKWRAFEPDVLPMPVAEMDFALAEPIKAILHSMVDNSDTGYLGAIPELIPSFARFAHSRWNWTIDESQVFVASDVGVGMVETLRVLTNPGDLVMLNSPIYHNFFNWIQEVGCQLVDVPLREQSLEYRFDFDSIEAGYKSGVKVHLLCHPHNPIGTVHSADELRTLAELAARYGVKVISDEVHGPLTFESKAFVPFLDVSETARRIGLAVTAASKSWNIAGLKCALVISQSQEMLDFLKQMPAAMHYRASIFGAQATATAFDCVDWLDGALRTLDSNRKLLAQLLSERLPSVGYRQPDFGYLTWLDLTSLDLGPNPAAVLLEEARVAFNAGSTFGPASSQFVRMNIATSPENISEAVDRIARVVKSI